MASAAARELAEGRASVAIARRASARRGLIMGVGNGVEREFGRIVLVARVLITSQ